MNKEEYQRALKEQDWGFQLTDDQTVWRRGLESMASLRKAQLIHDPVATLWNEACPPFYCLKVDPNAWAFAHGLEST